MDLKQTSLFLATPEQIKVHRKRTFVQWGRGLSPEEYAKRDEALNSAALAHCADGKFAVWVLAPREDSTSDLGFFCGCETYRREVTVSDKAATDGLFIGYGIASVFTPAEHRKKGYAKHMMRLLHYVLAGQRQNPTDIPPFPVEKWGPPPTIPPGYGTGIVSALYSDVGPAFYRTCGIGLSEDNGWTVRSPLSTIWPVPAQIDLNESKVEWITDKTEKEIWEMDADRIKDEIQAATKPCFAFLPDQGVAESLKGRSHFYAPNPSKDGVWGVRISQSPESAVDSLAFAKWCLDPGREGPPTLIITRLRCTPTQFPTLLAAVFQAARNFKHEQVEIWNIDPTLQDIGTNLGGVTLERDDHLPSMAWYGSTDGKTVEWKYNEKFCWC